MSSPGTETDSQDDSSTEEKYSNGKDYSDREKFEESEESEESVESPKTRHVQSKHKEAEAPEIAVKEKSDSAKSPNNKEVTRVKRVPTQVMVDKALVALNGKSGSSIFAIKKYILANFDNLSESRINFFILKYLKKSISEGKIMQTKLRYKIVNKPATSKVLPKKKPILTGKSANNEKSSKSSSNAKINVKTTTLSENSSKKQESKTTTKTIEPSNSVDILKSQQAKKNAKATTTSNAKAKVPVKATDKAEPKAQKTIKGNKENNGPNMKPKVKEGQHKGIASKEPKASKTVNIKK